MERRGRKPLAARHVDNLEGSQHAKLRLQMILETMRGNLTIPQACARLSICESRFHALRSQWLQESLELLEPRAAGRPRKDQPLSDRESQLLADKEQLETDLVVAKTQREVTEIMSLVDPVAAKKKMRKARAKKLRSAQRGAKRRPR